LNFNVQIRVREQPHIVQQTLRWNRPGALLFHSRGTRTANAELQVRRGQIDPVTGGLDQHIGEYRDRCFLLNHTLRQAQFPNQIYFTYRELHHSFTPLLPFECASITCRLLVIP